MGLMKILKLVGGSIIDKPFEIVGRQLEFYQQRKNASHEQQLRQDEAKFMQQLEFDRQKLNAELDDMVARKEIERNSLVMEAIAKYQKTMAECTVSIGNSLGNMNIELRERATALVEDKQRQYSALQEAAMDKASAQLERIYEKFPTETRARTIMENAVEKQLNNIIETSDRFMRTIDADFSKMMDSVQRITESTMTNASQYISPAFANNALRGGDDTKLLK